MMKKWMGVRALAQSAQAVTLLFSFGLTAQAKKSISKKVKDTPKIESPFEGTGSSFYSKPDSLSSASKDLWSLKNLYLDSKNEECFHASARSIKKHKILVGWILNQQGECLNRTVSKKFDKYQTQYLNLLKENYSDWSGFAGQEMLRKQLFQNLVIWSRTAPPQSVLIYFEWVLDKVEGWSPEQSSLLYEAFGDYYTKIKRYDLAKSSYKRAYNFFARSILASKINEEGYIVALPVACTPSEEAVKAEILSKVESTSFKDRPEFEQRLKSLSERCRNRALNESFNASISRYASVSASAKNKEQKRLLYFSDEYLVPWIESQTYKEPERDLLPIIENDDFSKAIRAAASITLARAYFEDFKLAPAQEKYEDALKLEPTTSQTEDIHYRLALIFMRTKVLDRALQSWQTVLKSASGDLKIRALYWQRQIQHKLEMKTEAEQTAQELLRVSPDSVWGLKTKLELSQNKVDFFAESRDQPWPKEDLFVDVRLKRSVERFEALAQAGWWYEAHRELRSWPTPVSKNDRWARIHLHSLVLDYLGAYALMKEEELLFSLPKNWVAQLFPREFENFVNAEAKLNGVHPHFVWSVMKQESAYYPYARSPARAMGLLQLLGDTAKEMAKISRVPKFKPEDLYKPDINIKLGTTYLTRLLKKYQSHVPLTLVAYNAGMGRLDRWLKKRGDLKAEIQSRQELFEDLWVEEIPWKESQTYVRRILRNWLIMKGLYENGSQSSTPVWSEVLIQSSEPPK